MIPEENRTVVPLVTGSTDAVGPGIRLRMAREQLGLSVEVVAKAFNLSCHLIQAIEKDDYTRAPGQVFVRGYLRAYAKLVQLPADEIVDAFNSLQVKERSTGRPTRQFYRQQVTVKSRSMRWVTYLIGVSLIVLVAVWWQSQRSFERKRFLPEVSAALQDLHLPQMSTSQKPDDEAII